MDDILKALRETGFKPEVIEDDTGFAPFNGRYIARIDGAGRVRGTSTKTGEPYDFRSINLQVAEIIDGDKATNRFLKLTYNLDTKGMQRLLNDLHTAGIECPAKSDNELDAWLETLKDKTMNIRCWVWTPEKDRDGNIIPEDKRIPRQQSKVVKEFKSKKKPDTIASDVPF